MRLLLVLIGAAAVIGLAAPAYADPDDGPGGDDPGFLAALHGADIGYSNPAAAIGSAHAVCTCLSNGESGLELINDVKTHNPAFNMDAAAQFAVIAAKYYCPQHLSKS
ncbi:DUF732 domain-containing protein [Mycobacterium asiaticum]|uniref:Glycine cleavage system P protein n=1 Tax=Mycobacterium asiaticum TaxID=1790 RepID=A0A1A3KWV2_MYCAS|nr:DUF732 domain-containing protein [Mycobacterium asiaticum]OBI92605.1 glycine cleavage system P protein [Mycobacterium asiaticum]OBJ48785.1 glycine cleavage system P protein [Mycobacterium asiaticum]OBJ89490.1 glycine cleavage system P protein [Mycobacterium asiaticum]ORA12192.1 glycine cleavage system P protein [Mycobacterium asiaticum DSM 44297]